MTPQPTLASLMVLLLSACNAATCGICPGLDAVGLFPNASLSVVTPPVGNAFPTQTSLAITGTTGQDDQREFLVSLGLISNRGNASRPTPYHDKVGLYVGVEAHPGTGDIWSMNPLVTQVAGSGDYNAQGIELDFNNENAHRGEADAGGGLAPPVSYGLSISGAAPFRSTSAMLVSGSGRIWNRGVVFANDCIQQSTFQDLGNPDKSIDIRGGPKYGVYQSNTKTLNYFAGGTGIGVGTLQPKATLHVGGDIQVDGQLLHSSSSTGLRRGAVLSNAAVGVSTVMSAGTGVFDEQGQAFVALPHASTSAVRVTSYQLTPIGAAMPNLHVLKEEATGFSVAGGIPDLRFSWQTISEQ